MDLAGGIGRTKYGTKWRQGSITAEEEQNLDIYYYTLSIHFHIANCSNDELSCELQEEIL